jgi:hypothetical protein
MKQHVEAWTHRYILSKTTALHFRILNDAAAALSLGEC